MEKKTKYLLLGLGVVTVGAGAFLYLQHQKKKKENANNLISDSFTSNSLPLPASPPTSSHSGSSSNSGFPLKKGSNGTLVKNLQNALIKKYGAGILPKYGADGGFGTETVNALLSKGLPTVITSDIFSQLVIGSGGTNNVSSGSSSSISNTLHIAISNNNLSGAISALKQIKNVAGYTAVNSILKKTRINFVRKTLVTALLDQFNTSSKKKQINAELYRIGLKYDGSKWALSGLYGFGIDQLVTIEPTYIWDYEGRNMSVPTATILGEYLDANDGVTEFETLDRKRLFVKTTSISYAQ